jgi:aminopeptidase N
MREVLSGLQYQKGAWILHMLRWEMGTETFWTGLREYYRRYRDSTASTADLIGVMEEASGQELDWFFDQWLHRTPSPVVEGSWRYDATTGEVEMELVQAQPGEAYTLNLEVGIGGDEEQPPEVQVIRMTQKRQRFRLAVGREPSDVVLDPNTWALVRGGLQRRGS